MLIDLLRFKTSRLVRRVTYAVAALAAYVVIAKSVDAEFDLEAVIDVAPRAAIAVVAVYVCAFLIDRRIRAFQKKTGDLFNRAGLSADE